MAAQAKVTGLLNQCGAMTLLLHLVMLNGSEMVRNLKEEDGLLISSECKALQVTLELPVVSAVLEFASRGPPTRELP